MLAAIGAIAVVGLASGLTLPLVSVRLAESAAPGPLIALMATLPALGTIAIASCLAMLTARVGARRLLLLALPLSCASILALLLPDSQWLWILSRLAMGVSAGILYALGESRILEISAAQTRGRWIGVYAATLTGCQLAGPALLAAFGSHSTLPLWIAAGLHALGFALIMLVDWDSNVPGEAQPQPLRASEFLSVALPLAIAIAYFAMFDSAILSLLPVYGLSMGFPERKAVLLASAVFLGDACLQVFVGWAADRIGRQRIHLGCGALTLLAALSIPLLPQGSPLLWTALFLMGGAAGGLYTLAIVQVGDRFSGLALVSANAFVGLLWGLGAICGPLAGSGFMSALGASGLLIAVAAGAALFVTVSWLRPAITAGTA